MIMVIHFLQRKHIVPNLQVATVLSPQCSRVDTKSLRSCAHVTADMTAPHRCIAMASHGVPLMRVHGP
jgi:hypothetical protein